MAANRYFSRCALLLVMLICTFQSSAQWPQPINFHEREGLLCGEIFQLACDDNNYIWIASEYGLYRYDGYRFKAFTSADGLPHEKIIDVMSNEGKVLVVSGVGGIFLLNGHVFEEHPLSPLLQKASGGRTPFPKTLNVGEDELSMCFAEIGTVKVTQSGQLNLGSNEDYLSDIQCFVNSVGHNDPVLLKVQEYINQYAAEIDRNEQFKKGKITYCKGVQYHFLNYGNLSFSLSNGVVSHQFLPTKILSLGYVDSILFYSYSKGGVTFHLPGGKLDLFSYLTVNHVVADKEGGVWIATESNGLYYLKNLWIKNFNISTDIYYMDVSDMAFSPEEDLLIAHRNYSIDKVSMSGDFLKSYTTHHRDGLSGLTFAKEYPVIAGISNKQLITVSVPEAQYRVKTHSLKEVHSTCTFADTLFVSTTNGIHFLDRRQGELKLYLAYNSVRDSRLFATSGRIFVAMDNALFEITHKQKKNTGYGASYPNTEITHISEFGNTLLVAFKDTGVIQISNGESHLLDKVHDFDLKSITHGCQNNEYLFFATKMGIMVIPMRSGYPNWDASIMLSQAIGISSLEIEKILVSNKDLYVKTKRSVDIVPLSEIERIPPVEIPTPELSINGQSVHFQDTLYLKNDDHSLQFYFPHRLYRQEGNIRLRYFVAGLNDQKVETDQPLVSIINIPYGSFEAVFQIKDNKGGWSEPLVVSIFKNEPIYKKTWFIVLGLFAAFSLVAYAIFLRVILNYKKNELLAERKEHSHNILAQQLNPHFTFNSLNAIQHFVLTNNREESSRYLVKFSNLMRSVIDFSRKEYISIEDEISSLHLYVELEQLRFPGKFTFSASVESQINRNETLTIPFLIQPLVENAIRHGVTQRDTPGHIDLEIKLISDFLMVCLTDNGIGRAEAHRRKQNSQKQGVGLGNSILRQRINNYNAINQQKISVNVVDLFNDDGSASGTKVVVLLPYLLKSVSLDDYTK